MRKAQITTALREIGACWAVTSNKCVLPEDRDPDGGRPRPAYHVHPDATRPDQRAIRRFYSLDEIARYIAARKKAGALHMQGDYAGAERVMEDFEDSLLD